MNGYQRQVEFLDWEFGIFFHFGIRSFYPGHRDWDGIEMPAEGFDPKSLDCGQWIRIAKEAGATYAILTCKHHDGFALWPSAQSRYSVANTPWKDGKGDVVREFTDACREYGLKIGLYYSPAQWGSHAIPFSNAKEYDDYFIAQITELLSNYGKIDYLYRANDSSTKIGETRYFTNPDAYGAEIEDSRYCGRPIQAEILEDQHIKLTETGCFFCDNVGWKKVDFDTSQTEEMDGVRMLMILPHRPPVVTYVKDNLHDLQMAVSDHGEEALIEYTYPFDDDCMVLGNEEAKLNGMKGNRRLYGSIYAGPIYITRDDGVGGLCSLTDEQVQQYSEMFAEPHDISDEETQADVGFTTFGWY